MNIAATLTGLGQGLIYVIIGLFFIWLVKRLDDYRTKDFNDDTHIDDGNVAVGLRRAGLYLGIAIALSGAMEGLGHQQWRKDGRKRDQTCQNALKLSLCIICNPS